VDPHPADPPEELGEAAAEAAGPEPGSAGAGDAAESPAESVAAVRLAAVPARPAGSFRRALGSLRRLRVAAAIALAFGLFAAGAAWMRYEKPPAAEPPAVRFKLRPPALAPAEESGAAAQAAAAPVDWPRRLDEIDAHRRAVTEKRDEIAKLTRSCRYDALELEEELTAILRRSGYDSPSSALKDKRISFMLQSIQRRQAYVNGMEKPLAAMDDLGEELLFLKRRVELELSLQAVSDGVELESLGRMIPSVLEGVAPVMRALSTDPDGSYPQPPPDAIWKRVLDAAKAAGPLPAGGPAEAVTAEICRGDLGRASELTHLSLRSARCIAEAPGIALFLARLTELSPAAATKLREWPGRWLSLNGLTRLTPEVGEQLLRWPGDRLSLNGVKNLPAEAARFLPGWPGQELELMGLAKSNGLEYLVRWEEAGGRLFVNEALRREIDLLRGRPADGRAGR
jgi:hypothetical protein